MWKIDPLVDETAQRLYGLNALIELVYRATPEAELQARDALKLKAKHESWDSGDFQTENQFLDVQFKHWLPTLSAYSIIIMLSSIVEIQLLAFARSLGRHNTSTFDPNDLKGSVVEKTALYVKKVCGLELGKNARWQKLRDLQDLRDIIVHRGGKPTDRSNRVGQMSKTYPGISLAQNPYTVARDLELSITVHACRYFASEVEEFFKGLFRDADLPVKSGLWPNIDSGFSQGK